MNWMMLGILGYVLLQLGIGFVVSRRVSTESDYLVAGRSLGLRLSVFTVFATWFGAETCIGATARAYETGLAGVTADPFGYAACLLLMGGLLAVPLWKRKLTTLADLFRERFGAGAERFVVVLLVPTSVMWAGAQIRAFGQILGASSELALTTTITIAAAVVIGYTAMGGMLADAYSDFIQGIVLLLGLFLMLLFMSQSGDLDLAFADASTLRWHDPNTSLLDRAEAWCVPVVGSLVAQELIGRVVAARSPSIARSGTLIAALIYLAVGLIPVVVGLVAARVSPGLAEPEQVLVLRVAHYFPGFSRVIFIGALVSAILSTVDSALLAAGALTAHNLVLPFFPTVSEQRKLLTNRVAVMFFGFVAYGLALATDGVYELVEEASAFGTAGVFVCLMFGLFSRVGGRTAALSSLSLGIVVYLTGEHYFQLRQPYLTSVVAATFGYLAGTLFERVAASSVVNSAP